jgi:hypothetical protein
MLVDEVLVIGVLVDVAARVRDEASVQEISMQRSVVRAKNASFALPRQRNDVRIVGFAERLYRFFFGIDSIVVGSVEAPLAIQLNDEPQNTTDPGVLNPPCEVCGIT